ncbi:Fur family transcriptional regulator [Dehalogenimonas sp. 4OHTPN]|uniref:Fur family transcriptional regulator n=1 Tax=Dehalogenimonas sp. 4OHTPN TaxID=3166643 RepID=A0AAU8GB85_9CHLR
MTYEYCVFQALKAAGYKLTQQRRAIVGAVLAADKSMTPQALYAAAAKKHPEIGLVTVYRTLALLDQLGLLCQFQPDGAARSFKAGSREHHHHLVCRGCGEVVDFGRCPLELKTVLEKETGFHITDHRLEFTGFCRECQVSENRESKTAKGSQPAGAKEA